MGLNLFGMMKKRDNHVPAGKEIFVQQIQETSPKFYDYPNLGKQS